MCRQFLGSLFAYNLSIKIDVCETAKHRNRNAAITGKSHISSGFENVAIPFSSFVQFRIKVEHIAQNMLSQLILLTNSIHRTNSFLQHADNVIFMFVLDEDEKNYTDAFWPFYYYYYSLLQFRRFIYGFDKKSHFARSIHINSRLTKIIFICCRPMLDSTCDVTNEFCESFIPFFAHSLKLLSCQLFLRIYPSIFVCTSFCFKYGSYHNRFFCFVEHALHVMHLECETYVKRAMRNGNVLSNQWTTWIRHISN